jgi:hypothetical protein
MVTVFEPIRPVPPMTTIFMVYPPLSTTGDPAAIAGRRSRRRSEKHSDALHGSEATQGVRGGG